MFLSSVLSSLSCVFRSLSLGGLAGPNEAARSCVRVFVSVIRSPGTLRLPVTVPLLFPILVLTGAGLFCVALRFLGKRLSLNLWMRVFPFWAKSVL